MISAVKSMHLEEAEDKDGEDKEGGAEAEGML